METTTPLRPELGILPLRMRDLPIDERGYPVPYFVDWINGKPDFRVMNQHRWKACIKEQLCWVCGKKLGRYLCFVIGPMCGISRTTSEPPAHLECARWSAKNCPFLTRPHMTRHGREELEARGACPMGGIAIPRNPGVALLWITVSYGVWRPPQGGYLIRIGDPIEMLWFSQGRPATYAEVFDSVESGLPLLEATCEGQDGALEELHRHAKWLKQYYPRP